MGNIHPFVLLLSFNSGLKILNNEGGFKGMTYVITEPCIDVKDTACVDVCPVDCIHPTKNEDDFGNVDMLFIDPDECIDCGV